MNNIILCGFMGCGKTTVGKTLAELTGAQFVDMDEYIESKAGLTVSRIFERYGEPHFRRLESEAAKALASQNGLVIATGGGAVLNPMNVALFKKSGKIVLLEVPLTILKARLAGDNTRPLLNRPDKDDAILSLYLQRLPKYREAADIRQTNDSDMPAMEMAFKILQQLGSPYNLKQEQ